MGFLRRKPRGDDAPSAEIYDDLRRQVLELTPEQLDVGEVPILALLMETGYPEGVATVVAIADGTTSLYFSNGGGIIGAGTHEPVADASRRWLRTGEEFLSDLSETADPPPPSEGMTQFVVVTREGLRGDAAPEEQLGEGEHRLSPLFHAGHDVITQIRLAEES